MGSPAIMQHVTRLLNNCDALKRLKTLKEWMVRSKTLLDKILLANCKTERDPELPYRDSELDILIRQQYLDKRRKTSYPTSKETFSEENLS
jgi:predicted metal-binding protein